MIYPCNRCGNALDFSQLPPGQYACPACGQQFDVPAITPPPIISHHATPSQQTNYRQVQQPNKPKWPKYGLATIAHVFIYVTVLFFLILLLSAVYENDHRYQWSFKDYIQDSGVVRLWDFIALFGLLGTYGYFFYKDSQG